jgi:pimeloyl-ACP methyl ester carboxylesterase
MKKFLALLSSACCLCSIHAMAQHNPVGNWLGTLSAGGGKMRVVVHVSDSAGIIHATMDSPDQNVKGIKVPAVRYAGDSLLLFLGSASYAGKFVDNNNIEGTWTQGQAFPLKLERSDLAEKPQTPVPPFPYLSEEVSFTNKDGSMTYSGTVTAPGDGKRHPALLLQTGSGQQNRDEEILGHKPFMVIADYLTRRGYVVLRVDDRGVGKTTRGDIMKATTADFASDANTELDYLKERPEVDKGKMGVLGHSEGGMIAFMLAAQRKDLVFIISMAGPGVPNKSLMIAQNDALLKQAGVPEASRKAYLQLYDAMVVAQQKARNTMALTNAIDQAVSDWRRKTSTEIVQNTTSITDSATQRRFVSTFATQFDLPWFRYFMSYDPEALAGNVTAKVLALNGDKDVQVPAELSQQGWRSLLAKSHSRKHEVKVLPGLNHLFQECKRCDVDEYGELDQTISPIALATIADWLDKEVK